MPSPVNEGISFSANITLGDVIALLGLAGTVAYNYFAIWRRIDRVSNRVELVDTRIKTTDEKFEDLRRGRGLIMESWPQAMQRVMGFRNGPH